MRGLSDGGVRHGEKKLGSRMGTQVAVLERMIGTGLTEKVTFEWDLTLLRGWVYPRMSQFSTESVDSMSKVPRNPETLQSWPDQDGWSLQE